MSKGTGTQQGGQPVLEQTTTPIDGGAAGGYSAAFSSAPRLRARTLPHQPQLQGSSVPSHPPVPRSPQAVRRPAPGAHSGNVGGLDPIYTSTPIRNHGDEPSMFDLAQGSQNLRSSFFSPGQSSQPATAAAASSTVPAVPSNLRRGGSLIAPRERDGQQKDGGRPVRRSLRASPDKKDVIAAARAAAARDRKNGSDEIGAVSQEGEIGKINQIVATHSQKKGFEKWILGQEDGKIFSQDAEMIIAALAEVERSSGSRAGLSKDAMGAVELIRSRQEIARNDKRELAQGVSLRKMAEENKGLRERVAELEQGLSILMEQSSSFNQSAIAAEASVKDGGVHDDEDDNRKQAFHDSRRLADYVANISRAVNETEDGDLNLLAQLESENKALRGKVGGLEKKLKQALNDVEALVVSQQEREKEIPLEIERGRQEHIATISAEVEKVIEAKNNAEAFVAEFSQRNEALSAQVNAAQEALKEMGEQYLVQIGQLGQRNVELESNLQGALVNIRWYEGELQSKQAEIEAITESGGNLKTKIQELEDDILRLESEKFELSQQLAGGQNKALFDKNITELNNELNKLRTLQNNYDAALGSLNEGVAIFEGIAFGGNKELLDEVEKFKDGDDLITSLNKFRKRIFKLKDVFLSKLEESRAKDFEMARLQEGIDNLSRDIGFKDEKIKEISAQLESALKQNVKLEEQLAEDVKVLGGLRGELDAARREMQRLQAVDANLQKVVQELGGAQSRIREIEEELVSIRDKNSQLLDEIAARDQLLKDAEIREAGYRDINLAQQAEIARLRQTSQEMRAMGEGIEQELNFLRGAEQKRLELEKEKAAFAAREAQRDLELASLREQLRRQAQLAEAASQGSDEAMNAARRQIEELRAANLHLATQHQLSEGKNAELGRRNLELEGVARQNEAQFLILKEQIGNLTQYASGQAREIAALEAANQRMSEEALRFRQALFGVYQAEMSRGDIGARDGGGQDLQEFLDLTKQVEEKGREFARQLQQAMTEEVAIIDDKLKAEAQRRELERRGEFERAVASAKAEALNSAASVARPVEVKRSEKKGSFISRLASSFRSPPKDDSVLPEPVSRVATATTADAATTATATAAALQLARALKKGDGGVSAVAATVGDAATPQPQPQVENKVKILRERFESEMAQMVGELTTKAAQLKLNGQKVPEVDFDPDDGTISNDKMIYDLSQRLHGLHNKKDDLETALQILTSRQAKRDVSFAAYDPAQDVLADAQHLAFLYNTLQVLEDEGVSDIFCVKSANVSRFYFRVEGGNYHNIGIEFFREDVGAQPEYSVIYKASAYDRDFTVFDLGTKYRAESIGEIEGFVVKKIKEHQERKVLESARVAALPVMTIAPVRRDVVLPELTEGEVERIVQSAVGIVFRNDPIQAAEKNYDKKRGRLLKDVREAVLVARQDGVGLFDHVAREQIKIPALIGSDIFSLFVVKDGNNPASGKISLETLKEIGAKNQQSAKDVANLIGLLDRRGNKEGAIVANVGALKKELEAIPEIKNLTARIKDNSLAHNEKIVTTGVLNAVVATGLCLSGKQGILEQLKSEATPALDEGKFANKDREEKAKYRYLNRDFLDPSNRKAALGYRDFAEIVGVATAALEQLDERGLEMLFASVGGFCGVDAGAAGDARRPASAVSSGAGGVGHRHVHVVDDAARAAASGGGSAPTGRGYGHV